MPFGNTTLTGEQQRKMYAAAFGAAYIRVVLSIRSLKFRCSIGCKVLAAVLVLDFIKREVTSAFAGIENLSVINSTLYVFILDIGHHAGYLEKAMRTEGIKFDEIKV